MSKYLPVRENESSLEKHVRCWINKTVKEGYDNWKEVFRDLSYGGCESGYVDHLIEPDDYQKFLKNHIEEICELIEEFQEEYDRLPFHNSEFSSVILAWKGFELMAKKIAVENGYYD